MAVLAGHQRQTALRFEVCRLGAVCARICARSIANIEAKGGGIGRRARLRLRNY
jgi:hypothetical protein